MTYWLKRAMMLGAAVVDAWNRGVTVIAEAERQAVQLVTKQTGERSAQDERLVFPAARWASDGFPMVEPSHRLAASLMCTAIPRDSVTAALLPWSGFAIAVPDRLINNNDTPDPAHLLVTRAGNGLVSCYDFSPSWCANWQLPLADFTDLSIPDGVAPEFAERRAHALGRLVVGVCLELDAVGQKVLMSPQAGGGKSWRTGPPKCWTFKLTRAVRADVRAAVQAYVREGGRSPTVQTLVRGHHKRQPCGPGAVQRKWIHVEPYWRGPEDAPIAVHRTLVGPAS